MISTVIKTVLFITTTTTGITAIAQSKWSKWEIGGGVSGYVYQGDLTPRRLGSVETTKPGILLFANYQLKSRISLQGAFAWGGIRASEGLYNTPEWRKYRALYFKTPVKELSTKIIYTFRGNEDYQQYYLMPYIGTGVNLSFFNVKRNYSEFNTKFFEPQPSVINGLNKDINTKPPRMLVTVPIVLGVRRPMNERFDLFAELNYRILFNDYVDGFSYAANPKRNDHFYTITVGALYKFRRNNSIKCPSY
jgi:Domain of unknown function (DUF6089)